MVKLDKIVAIVGRPNVGKSTIFNRLVKKRSAIVDFEEGITRDRKSDWVFWNGKRFVIVDTGGIVPKADDKINKAIKYQVQLAIEESDVILFVVDAKTGTTDLDTEISKILSPYRKKVMLVVNKVDSEKDDMEIYDFLQLGLGEAFPIAASGGRNTGNFLDELLLKLKPTELDTDFVDDSIKVAIVGKPNVGKSSIINRLIGREALIVTDIAGTTRDSTDTILTFHGKELTFIDTAGLRRKKRVKYGVEYFSTMRTIDSIDRSDIVLLILNATEEISDQDQKIASYAFRRKKDIIVIVNKWDLIEKNNSTTGVFIQKIKDDLGFLDYAPFIFTSALTGQRVQKILEKIFEVEEQSHKRISTGELNKFLEKTLRKYPPTHSSGKHVKIYYVTQVNVHPPVFIFFCSNPDHVTVHYQRFLNNQIREEFQYTGASIKLKFNGRGSNDTVTN